MEAAAKFTSPPSNESSIRGKSNERVFVIAPLGHDAVAMSDLLTAQGFETYICEDPNGVCEEIPNAGAIVMTEEALEFVQTTNLLSALSNQPPWSELPLIILTSGGQSRLIRLLDLAARAAGSVTLLERAIGTETLIRTVQVALRSRRRILRTRVLWLPVAAGRMRRAGC
jgi:FixJ family two-component response regulator